MVTLLFSILEYIEDTCRRELYVRLFIQTQHSICNINFFSHQIMFLLVFAHDRIVFWPGSVGGPCKGIEVYSRQWGWNEIDFSLSVSI